jgi:signal transduction histidine kinase
MTGGWNLRQEWRVRLLLWIGMAGLVVAVFVIVVLGGGLLTGRMDRPAMGLSVLATAVVALAFEPARRRLERVAKRWIGGGRTAPYDLLTGFADSVTGSFPADELPARTAMILADATGAAWAQVWLSVRGQFTLAATWPGDDVAANQPPDVRDQSSSVPGRHIRAVQYGGRTLGALTLQLREGSSLTPVEERLFASLATQAGMALRSTQLRAELAQRLIELSVRAEELQASRARLVATQDEERQRLERDIHDGAQQHLVALGVNLRLAKMLASRAPERAAQLVAEQQVAAEDAMETLSRLANGIYPAVLAHAGLESALCAAAAASPIPVEVDSSVVDRFPGEVEASLYFCGLEALQNAAKHSGATRITVQLRLSDGLRLEVADDGLGFPSGDTTGSGVANMLDRIESVGGTLSIDSHHGRGTTVCAKIPQVVAVDRPVAAAQGDTS